MNFRLRVAAWFGVSLAVLTAILMAIAHWHLDNELRHDKWDRSHPKYPNWSIHGSFTDAEVQDILGELMKVWLWVGVPVVGLALGIGFLLARRSIRPIDAINRELSLLEAKSLHKGIAVPENDPVLSDLVRHINRLLERVGNAYHNLDEFASKVAHEIRTPLTLLRMKIERSAADLPPGFSEELQDEVARVTRLVEQSLLAAKAESGHVTADLQEVNVTLMLGDLFEGYDLLARERHVDFDWSVANALGAFTDPGFLRQILHNLLGNAVRYARRRIRVRAHSADGDVIVTMANDLERSVMTSSGIGLGLRLVRGLSSTLKIGFRQRATDAIFATRLRIPGAMNSVSPREVSRAS